MVTCMVVVTKCVSRVMFFFFFKQKTAYEMRISDWSSDVCSSDLAAKDTGQMIEAITRRTTQAYHDDMAALCALPPTVEPRATQHIFQMVAMIEALIDKGHAYAADGHVLFSVPSLADYGALSRLALDELHAAARNDLATPEQRHVGE